MNITSKQQKEWREAHIKSALERLNITRKDYKRFLIIGNKLHRIYEMSCNGHTGNKSIYLGNKMMNEYTEKMYERDTTPLYKKANEMAKELKLNIFYQTDPRGATIYLDTEEIKYDNYNKAVVIY